MSVNYNNNGQLVNIGNTRVWIGTKAAHNALVTAGKMPNNCMVYLIDNVSGQADTTPTLNSTNLITSGGVYDTFAYRQSSAVVCVFRRMKSDGSGVEETGTTHQCLVLPLLGAEKLALIIGDGEVNVNTTENQQKFSFALSGIAANGIVNDGCLNIAIEGQPSPYLGYAGGFGDFWVNGIPTGLSNTKCRARFMCVCKLQ